MDQDEEEEEGEEASLRNHLGQLPSTFYTFTLLTKETYKKILKSYSTSLFQRLHKWLEVFLESTKK